MDDIELVVIGAGAVGLAIARALARDGRETLILEAAEAFGTGVSSRNSEVIHAGIYYPQGSLKARFCVAGRAQLYDFCARQGVAHRRCGKLIVATSPEQLGQLETIAHSARANGVELEPLERGAALALEPALACTGALLSRETGILDAHGYMLALLGEAEGFGAMLATRSRVQRLWLESDAMLLAVNGSEPTLRAAIVVNCGGLDAPAIAGSIVGFPPEHVPQAFLAKGSYFKPAGRAPFQRLIYPMPEPGGLGVHLTLDLNGEARFGPDVEWVERRDYQVDPARAARFYDAVRRYWPALADGALQPAYSGIRPKLSGPGQPAADFRIDGPAVHGAPLVNLFGIESPGLTSSLAIAEYVADQVRAL